MSLAEWIMAGSAYADMMEPDGKSKPPPTDEDFDDMLAAARAVGFLPETTTWQ